jgi:hypothetical protein
MRAALIIFPILALAACATPRETCISQSTRDLQIMSSLINETQGNIARGFALAERQEVRTLSRICRGRNADGSSFAFPCDETETFTRTEPVAIDLNAEQAKLNSLIARQAQMRTTTDQAVLQCIALHPE